jgi:hypothetical protein
MTRVRPFSERSAPSLTRISTSRTNDTMTAHEECYGYLHLHDIHPCSCDCGWLMETGNPKAAEPINYGLLVAGLLRFLLLQYLPVV